MRRLAVWAPVADRVEIEIGPRGSEGGRRHPLERSEHGWWETRLPVGPGVDYGFRLDDGALLPDPRSPWQPHGVHGPSRTVDHDAFAWSDARWRGVHLPSCVVYELHVGTFTPEGTFDAAIGRLDHLVELGIDVVELMPVNAFPGRHGWGYDGVALYAPHDPYGGPEGMKRFVDACHARGLGVALDVVYNHLGPSGNYLGQYGPYFTDRYATPWGSAVNLDDRDSDEVRAFFIDNALGWLRDYHVDGLRIDAVHAIVDTSALHLLEELGMRVEGLARELGRPLFCIAESDLNDPRLLHAREAGGFGLDAQWSDDFHHALHAVLTGERDGYYVDFGALSHVAAALERAYVYDGRRSAFRRRRHGRSAHGLSGARFLGYLQNHDQVGNRARGDRSSHLVSTRRLEVGAALVLTSPFVPMLFQGEEWGASTPFPYFCDHPEPELAEAVRQGRRAEFAAFGWSSDEIPDPQAPATFEGARIEWSEREREPHTRIEAWHRSLIALRRRSPELLDGDLARVRARADDAAGTLFVERGALAVAVNLAESRRELPAGGRPKLVLTNDDTASLRDDRLTLAPDSVAILGPD